MHSLRITAKGHESYWAFKPATRKFVKRATNRAERRAGQKETLEHLVRPYERPCKFDKARTLEQGKVFSYLNGRDYDCDYDMRDSRATIFARIRLILKHLYTLHT
jgi:hypothetical protein